MTYSCPRCKRSDGLWEGVELTGWRAIGLDGKPTGGVGFNDCDVYWEHASPDGCAGCGECSWEGGRSDLLVDGKPQVQTHPQQQRFAVTAPFQQELSSKGENA